MKIIALVFISLLLDGAIAAVAEGPAKNLIQMVAKAYAYRGKLQAEHFITIANENSISIDSDRIRRIIATGNKILSLPKLTRTIGPDDHLGDGYDHAYIVEALADVKDHIKPIPQISARVILRNEPVIPHSLDTKKIWIDAQDVRMYEEDAAAVLLVNEDGRSFYINYKLAELISKKYFMFLQTIGEILFAVEQKTMQDLVIDKSKFYSIYYKNYWFSAHNADIVRNERLHRLIPGYEISEVNGLILHYHSLSGAHYRQYISTEAFISGYEDVVDLYRNLLPPQVIQDITEDIAKIKTSIDAER